MGPAGLGLDSMAKELKRGSFPPGFARLYRVETVIDRMVRRGNDIPARG